MKVNQQLVVILAVVFLFTQNEVTGRGIYTLLKKRGFDKEYRICNTKTLMLFFRVICRYHRPTVRTKLPSVEISNFVEKKRAHTFLRTRHSIPHQSTDQNYIDECCNHKKFGCNVHEIHGYCDSIPRGVITNLK